MSKSSQLMKSAVIILCLSLVTTIFLVVDISSKSEALYDPDKGTISGGVYDSKSMRAVSAQITGSVYAYAAGGFFSVSVSPGYYSLHASASGYYGSTKSVYVYKGQRASVSFYLTPVPGSSTGSISGSVSNAKTYAPISSATISGSLYMSAYGGYFSKSNVEPGYYSLTASASGYQSSTKSVYVYENQKASVNFYLTPYDTGSSGSDDWWTGGQGGTGSDGTGGTTTPAPTIRISQPQNGADIGRTVTISGTMTGVTSNSIIHVYLNGGDQGDIQGTAQWSIGPVNLNGWPTGEYTVGVQADNGQKSQMVTVKFIISDPKSLEPQQPGQPENPTDPGGTTPTQTKGSISGSVYASGTFNGISGATVSIGVKTTTTDSVGSYTLTDLGSGKYTISASKPGYNPAWANVTVNTGETTLQDLSLAPASSGDGGANKTVEDNRPKGSVAGRVCEFNTSSSISGVTVSVDGTGISVITDTYGSYLLTDVKIGNYSIIASKQGYISKTVSVEVKALETTIQDIYLKSVDNSRPVAFLSVTPLNAAIGETITFNANDSFDPEGGVIQYLFDFGDGNKTAWTSISTQTHQYEVEGVYYASLVVRNNLNINSSKPVKIPIYIGTQTNTLTPVLTVDYETAKVGQTISFDGLDSKSSGGESIAEYLFDFGDEEETTDWTDSPIVTHAYEDEGEYTASLRVKDASGAISAETCEVQITISAGNSPPTASFTVSAVKAAPGERIFFDASSSYDPDSDSLRYYFSYGNGKNSGWMDSPVTSYTYTRSGSYPVQLIVKDDKEAQNTAVRKITITITNIDAVITPMDGKTQINGTVFANPGDTVSYILNITNRGEFEDVIEMTSIKDVGNWSMETTNMDTLLSLTDTNKNGVIDIGSVDGLGHKDILVRLTIPKNCPPGAVNTTTLILFGTSKNLLSAPSLSDASASSNQTKSVVLKVATYPDFSIKDAVKLSSKEVNRGDKLNVFVNVTNIGSFVVDNATNITVIVYDGGTVKDNDIVNGKEIGRKTVPVKIGGEMITIDCTLDQPGRHFINVKALAPAGVNETKENNIVANKEVLVLGTASGYVAISMPDLLWLAAISVLCGVISVNQYFLFWRQKKNEEKKQQGGQGGFVR